MNQVEPQDGFEPSDQVEPSDHEEGEQVLRIILPWPSRTLHPNSRPHWAVKARAVKQGRAIAAAVTREALRSREAVRLPDGLIPVTVTFMPPNRQRRDDDGCVTAFKAARDGIADALQVDDSRFRCAYVMAEPVSGGAVAVDLAIDCARKGVEREGGVGGCHTALPEWLRS
jgi:crossover junction endodeoxyribonuclease RusA